MTNGREQPPTSLAQKLSGRGECPIPLTHDRLQELHYWWHEMGRTYHEPDPFRWSLGAYIQAARSVTFMLQKERGVFETFDWYDAWVAEARKDTLLRWLNDVRSDVVHRQALETHSWLRMVCVGRSYEADDPDDHPFEFRANPFLCTHYYIEKGPWTNHGHEFTRHWSIAGVGDRELLEVTADIYDKLDILVVEAHARLGHGMKVVGAERVKRAMPCMEDIARHRIVTTVVRDGREVWENQPQGVHDE